MDAAYLESTIGCVLSEGLAATILNNPMDKLDYLAKWLKQHVEEKKQKQQQLSSKQQLKQQDALYEKTLVEQTDKETLEKNTREKYEENRKQRFDEILANAQNIDELLPQFLNALRDYVSASGVYVATPDVLNNANNPDNPSLKYVAASNGHEWLLEKKLERSKGKVTFGLLEQPEEEEEEEEVEEDEDGNRIVKPKKEKDPRSLFLANVLLGAHANKIYFHKQIPQSGCYFAVHLKYKSLIDDGVLDESLERDEEIMQLKKEQEDERARREEEELGIEDEQEEDEGEQTDEDEDPEDRKRRKRAEKLAAKKQNQYENESEEQREEREELEAEKKRIEDEDFLIANLNRPQKDYILCLDTLGTNTRFSSEQQQVIISYSKRLLNKLQELERNEFTNERKQRANLLEIHRSLRSEEKNDDEKNDELEKISEELEASGKPMTDQDVIFKWRCDQILNNYKSSISEWNQLQVFRGDLNVLKAVFYLLGYAKNEVCDADERPEWNKIKKKLDAVFFHKLANYEPRATTASSCPKELLHSQQPFLSKLIAEWNVDEIRERNFILAELLCLVKDALEVKKKAKLERQIAQREEERKKRQAEEEAEAERQRLEEEAERAANGETREDGDDEEPEDEDDDE